jgi:transcriptional antiterminator RfaH
MSYWTVAQCETQRMHLTRLLLMRGEYDASGELIRGPYETYMPLFKSKAGKILLLFPSYIFVKITVRWYPVAKTPGVTRVLMAGDQPARLPEDIVSTIRKREVGGLVKLPSNERRLHKGDKVKITRGSFEGQIGIYDGMSPRQRERVLLQLLGSWVPVELASTDVAAIAPPQGHAAP